MIRVRPPELAGRQPPVPTSRALSGRSPQGSARNHAHETSAGQPNGGCTALSRRHDTPRSAPLVPTSAKRRQRRQPVKPLGRIRNQGKHPELGTDGHILAVCTILAHVVVPSSRFERRQTGAADGNSLLCLGQSRAWDYAGLAAEKRTKLTSAPPAVTSITSRSACSPRLVMRSVAPNRRPRERRLSLAGLIPSHSGIFP